MTEKEKQKLIGDYFEYKGMKLKIISYSIIEGNESLLLCERNDGNGWKLIESDDDVWSYKSHIGKSVWFVDIKKDGIIVKKNIHEKIKEFKV
jgi:hypothetical protein